MRAHAGGRIGTQRYIRAVTSWAEIGLVSPVIRQRGERGENWKKGNCHYTTSISLLHLHLYNNFISTSRRWMPKCTAMPLWNLLELIEYLYADSGALHFFSFLKSIQHAISHPPTFPAHPPPPSLSLISSFRIAFVRIWHYFYTPKGLHFFWLRLKGPAETHWAGTDFGEALLDSPHCVMKEWEDQQTIPHHVLLKHHKGFN